VAISLHTATTGSVAGLEETALRALTKLQQMLPSRLRHRISAFHADDDSADRARAPAGPGGPRTADRPSRRPCRDQRRLRVSYPGRDGITTRNLEPHRLVPHVTPLVPAGLGHRSRRLADVPRRPHPGRTGPARRPLHPPPAAVRRHVAAYVSQAISSAPYRYQARILIRAPLEGRRRALLSRGRPAGGRRPGDLHPAHRVPTPWTSSPSTLPSRASTSRSCTRPSSSPSCAPCPTGSAWPPALTRWPDSGRRR